MTSPNRMEAMAQALRELTRSVDEMIAQNEAQNALTEQQEARIPDHEQMIAAREMAFKAFVETMRRHEEQFELRRRRYLAFEERMRVYERRSRELIEQGRERDRRIRALLNLVSEAQLDIARLDAASS